jgi:hypothetical protein
MKFKKKKQSQGDGKIPDWVKNAIREKEKK